MMMMAMGSLWMFLLYSLLMLALVLGFAYILWVMAAKESGNARLIGQIISVVVIVLVVLLWLYCAVKGGKIRHNMMGQGMMKYEMMKQGMPGHMDKTTHEMKK